MSTHDQCEWNCGSTDCDAPVRPKPDHKTKIPHDFHIWTSGRAKRRALEDWGYIIASLIVVGTLAYCSTSEADALYDVRMPEPVEVPTC